MSCPLFIPDLQPIQFCEELRKWHPQFQKIEGVTDLHFNLKPFGLQENDVDRWVMIEPKIPDGRVAWIIAEYSRDLPCRGSGLAITLGTKLTFIDGPLTGDRQHSRPLGDIFERIVEAIQARLSELLMGQDRARGKTHQDLDTVESGVSVRK